MGGALVGEAEFLVQGGIAGFPDLMTRAKLKEVEGAGAEGEADFLGLVGMGLEGEDAAALLGLIGAAGVEDHAISGFDRCLGEDPDAVVLDAEDLAEVGAAFLAETAVDQFLVVATGEPAGVEAPAEGHFQFVTGLNGIGSGGGWRWSWGLSCTGNRDGWGEAIEGLTVGAGDTGDVLG
jgi:hypothetical protein